MITATPLDRKNRSLPPKVVFSPMTTRGMPNWMMVPLHIMQGLSEV